MNDKLDNQIITEKMGMCWHEIVTVDAERVGSLLLTKTICKHCQKHYSLCDDNPDFTTPEGFFKAWDWAKGQEWFDKFMSWLAYPHFKARRSLENSNRWLIEIDQINPPVFVAALARFIKEVLNVKG